MDTESILRALVILAGPAAAVWGTVRWRANCPATRGIAFLLLSGYYLGLLILPMRSGVLWIDAAQIVAALAGFGLALKGAQKSRSLQA